jgi:hypothetical protein
MNKQLNEFSELELLKVQREVYQNLMVNQQNLLAINNEIKVREEKLVKEPKEPVKDK